MVSTLHICSFGAPSCHVTVSKSFASIPRVNTSSATPRAALALLRPTEGLGKPGFSLKSSASAKSLGVWLHVIHVDGWMAWMDGCIFALGLYLSFLKWKLFWTLKPYEIIMFPMFPVITLHIPSPQKLLGLPPKRPLWGAEIQASLIGTTAPPPKVAPVDTANDTWRLVAWSWWSGIDRFHVQWYTVYIYDIYVFLRIYVDHTAIYYISWVKHIEHNQKQWKARKNCLTAPKDIHSAPGIRRGIPALYNS